MNLQDSVTLVSREFCYFHDIAFYVLITVSLLVARLLGFLWVNYDYRTTYLENKGLEIIWTLIPAFVLILLAIPSLKLLFFLETPTNMLPFNRVKVIGHQWYWSYNYNFGGTTIDVDRYMVGESDLPKGEFRLLEVDVPTPINSLAYTRIVTTSADVIHSFAVPALGVKLDAVPGRLNQQFILPNRLGLFYGQCSEICGANHSFMPIRVEVLPVGLNPSTENEN